MVKHVYVIAEIHKSEHIGEYQGRTWRVEAKNRVEAMKQIDQEYPDHGPMRVVDDDEGKK